MCTKLKYYNIIITRQWRTIKTFFNHNNNNYKIVFNKLWHARDD